MSSNTEVQDNGLETLPHSNTVVPEAVAEKAEAASGETEHEHTLYSEEVFHVGSFPITNSLINSWIAVAIIVALCLAIKPKIRIIPRGLQNFLETAIEGFLGMFDLVTGSRDRSIKFFPVVFAFFLFILINNWLGIVPGVGALSREVSSPHGNVLMPFFRGGTADLNTTLALAAVGVVISHIFGVFAIGFWNHFNKFINIKAFLEIPKKIKKDPMVIAINPVMFFIGIIEIIGEAAKMASLSFRLYGNIFAGEVLLASISALLAFGAPIPFLLLEVLVGFIQALIFSILILSYLSLNTSHAEH